MDVAKPMPQGKSGGECDRLRPLQDLACGQRGSGDRSRVTEREQGGDAGGEAAPAGPVNGFPGAQRKGGGVARILLPVLELVPYILPLSR